MVEGLRGEMTYTQEPPAQKGFLLKKRKWPLKGWHKVRHQWWLLIVGHTLHPSQYYVLRTHTLSEFGDQRRDVSMSVLLRSVCFPTEILLPGKGNLEICQEPN